MNYLHPIPHPENAVDYNVAGSRRGYQVYVCTFIDCGHYWGIRYQYDPETGNDNNVMWFGRDRTKIRRHY